MKGPAKMEKSRSRPTFDTFEGPWLLSTLTRYSTFCRIGTGLSYADFVGIRERKWIEWEKGEPLDFLQAATRSQDDKGDVYIRPEE